MVQESFSFNDNKLFVPRFGVRSLLVQEVYSGVVAGHFGEQKTLDTLQENFYWPHIVKDVHLVLLDVQHVKKSRVPFIRVFIHLYMCLVNLGIE